MEIIESAVIFKSRLSPRRLLIRTMHQIPARLPSRCRLGAQEVPCLFNGTDSVCQVGEVGQTLLDQRMVVAAFFTA